MGKLNTNLPVKCWETILERDDISWVGPSADADGFCFGTENGDVFWTDFDGKLQWELPHAAKLGEAINGIAFNAGQMCVTTRDETANWFLSTHKNRVRGGTIAGGAHGVVSGGSGDFFLPRGIAGLQNIRMDNPSEVLGWEMAPEERDMYFYEVASLATVDGEQVVACACRRSGLAMGKYTKGETFNIVTLSTPKGDFIDICPAGIPSLPSAAYALTRDGTIYPFDNVLADRNPFAMRFQSVGGTAYRILASGNFVFVLTSRALHVIHKLLVNDNGLFDDNRDSRMVTFALEAVDMNLVGDRWLLVLLTDQVMRLDLELLKQTVPEFPVETSEPESSEDSDHFIFEEMEMTSHKFDAKLVTA